MGRQQTILAAYRLCLAGSLTHPHDVYMEDYERAPSAYTLVYEAGQRARPRHQLVTVRQNIDSKKFRLTRTFCYN